MLFCWLLIVPLASKSPTYRVIPVSSQQIPSQGPARYLSNYVAVQARQGNSNLNCNIASSKWPVDFAQQKNKKQTLRFSTLVYWYVSKTSKMENVCFDYEWINSIL